MTDKRESLLEEINLLNERIHELRRLGKSSSSEIIELTRLIVELDNLGIDDSKDKE